MIPDVTALPCGSLLIHLGTLMPSGGGHIIRALERENRELRQANEILRKASACFAPPLGDCLAINCRAAGRSSTAVEVMVSFIDAHRTEYGVEPICKALPIAPSTYYDDLSKRADPAQLSVRARRDAALRPAIRRVFEENRQVYGVRKVWRQLVREGFDVARRAAARLMKDMGLQGIIRGKPHRTTVPDKKAPCPLYMRDDAQTKAYAVKRTAGGKTRREIIRCIKRYIVREIYHALCASPVTTTGA